MILNLFFSLSLFFLPCASTFQHKKAPVPEWISSNDDGIANGWFAKWKKFLSSHHHNIFARSFLFHFLVFIFLRRSTFNIFFPLFPFSSKNNFNAFAAYFNVWDLLSFTSTDVLFSRFFFCCTTLFFNLDKQNLFRVIFGVVFRSLFLPSLCSICHRHTLYQINLVSSPHRVEVYVLLIYWKKWQ